MQFRTTFVLLLVAVALVGWIWFVERHQESTDDRIRREVTGHTLDVSWGEVKAFEVTRAGVTVRLERIREPDVWEVVQPSRMKASKRAVDDVLARMEFFREKQRLPAPVDLAGLGLEPPRITFRVWWGEKSATIHLGDAVAVGKNPDRYARFEGADSAFTIDPQIFKVLDKSPSGFMERRLFDVDPAKLTKVSFEATGEGGGKAETVELVRVDDDWWIGGVHDVRPEPEEVARLLEAVKGAEVAEWLDDAGLAAAPAGLDRPWLRVTAVLQGPDGRSVTAEFGAPLDDKREGFYGRRPGQPGGFVVKAGVPNAFAPDLARLRSRIYFDLPEHHLIAVAVDSPWGRTRIEAVEGAGFRAVEPADLPVDYGSVQTQLTKLKAYRMAEFVGPAPADLAPFGLAQPRVVLAVKMQPPDRSRTDEYRFRLGWTDAAPEQVYAITRDGRELVLLDPAVAREFRKGPLAFRRKDLMHTGGRARLREFVLDCVIPAPAGGTPTRRVQTCTRTREKSGDVERDGPWQVREDGVEKPATRAWAEEVVTHLTDLFVLDYVETAPASRTPYGLDAPALTVTFTCWKGDSAAAGEVRDVLRIGGADADGMRYAALDSQPMVFLLDPSSVAAFERDLTLPAPDRHDHDHGEDPAKGATGEEQETPIEGKTADPGAGS